MAENQCGQVQNEQNTKHSKMQLSIQGHNQVSTVFSKGFYNSTQCGSGTYIIVLFFEKWNYQEVFLQVVDEKQDISCLLTKGKMEGLREV